MAMFEAWRRHVVLVEHLLGYLWGTCVANVMANLVKNSEAYRALWQMSWRISAQVTGIHRSDQMC